MPDEITRKPPEESVGKTGMGKGSESDGSTLDRRRALLKATLIGVPIVLTLKSKSAWAHDITPSHAGSLSGGSQHQW